MPSKYFNKKSSALLAAAISTVIGGQAGLASAQSGLTIEEVVVTATKRPETLQDVSVSVTAVSSDYMQDAGISDMVDVSMHVPALTVTTNSSPWNTSFRLRRIGNEGNIPTFEPDTGLFVDGAFRSKSGMGLGDLVDIERIEVLKGPQSTLYGKNVTAGVIGITTSSPSEDFSGLAEISAAEDGYFNVKAMLNGALTDGLDGRLTISHSERDYLQENVSGPDADDLNSSAIRGQLMFYPNESSSVRLIAGLVDRDFDNTVGDVEFAATTQAVVGIIQASGLTSNLAPISADNVMGNRKVNQSQGNAEFTQESYELTAIVTYDFENSTLTSISSYDEYDVNSFLGDTEGSVLDLGTYVDPQEGYSFSQEFRLTSLGGETVDWMTGVFAYHNNFTRGSKSEPEFVLGEDIGAVGLVVSSVAFPGTPLAGTPIWGVEGETGSYYNEQDTDTYGVFVSATWNVSNDLSITGGLRYGYEEKSAELITGNSGSVSMLPTSIAGDTGLVGFVTPTNSWSPSDSWDAVTGNLSAEYHWNEDVMTYLSIAHGFKAGGYNLGFGGATTPNTARPFDEETVDTVELGWKTHLLDSRLQFNGAIFYTEYTDFQAAAFLGLEFTVDNAEQVNDYGVEFDGLYLISETLTLNFAVSYVVAEYDEYTRGTCAFGATPEANGFCDLSGEDLPFAPRWKTSAGIQYETSLAGGDFYSRLDVSWVDDYIPSSSLDERHKQSDYTVANLKAGWRNENWDVSVWSKNLTDEDYAVQYAPDNVFGALVVAPGTPGGDGSQQVFLNNPRSSGVTVRYNF